MQKLNLRLKVLFPRVESCCFILVHFSLHVLCMFEFESISEFLCLVILLYVIMHFPLASPLVFCCTLPVPLLCTTFGQVSVNCFNWTELEKSVFCYTHPVGTQYIVCISVACFKRPFVSVTCMCTVYCIHVWMKYSTNTEQAVSFNGLFNKQFHGSVVEWSKQCTV